MSSDKIGSVEEHDGVLQVRLDRPEQGNRIDAATADALRSLWRELRLIDTARAVVVTAEGPDFCHGMAPDLDAAFTDSATGHSATTQGIGPKAHGLYKPVVCAVQGYVGEGGWHLVGEADIVIAAPSAQFGGTGALAGRTCFYETVLISMRLPVGEVLRLELATPTGGGMDAERAYQLGLATEIVPEQDLSARALEIARALASADELPMQGSVWASWMGREVGRRDALAAGFAGAFLGKDSTTFAGGQQKFASGERLAWRLR